LLVLFIVLGGLTTRSASLRPARFQLFLSKLLLQWPKNSKVNRTWSIHWSPGSC